MRYVKLLDRLCRHLVFAGVRLENPAAARLVDLYPDANPPYLFVQAHGPRDARTVHLDDFAVPLLRAWRARPRAPLSIEGGLLFTLTPDGRHITDMSFGRIVATALEAIALLRRRAKPTHAAQYLLPASAACRPRARRGQSDAGPSQQSHVRPHCRHHRCHLTLQQRNSP